MAKLGPVIPARADWERSLGHPVGVVRHFAQDQSWSHPTFDQVRAAASAGIAVRTSFKPARSWGDVGRGLEDTRIRGILAGCDGLGIDVGVACNHEPEDDGRDPADFKAMQAHFLDLCGEYPNVKSAIVYMGSSFEDGAIDAYFADTLRPDILAADTYIWRKANQSPVDGWAKPNTPPTPFGTTGHNWARHLAFAKARGLVPELWEFACSREQGDTDGSDRTQMLAYWVDWQLSLAPADRFPVVCYFERNRGESGVVINWAVAKATGVGAEPASVAQLDRLTEAASPGDGCWELEEQVLTLTTALASAEAAREAAMTERDVARIEADRAREEMAAMLADRNRLRAAVESIRTTANEALA